MMGPRGGLLLAFLLASPAPILAQDWTELTRSRRTSGESALGVQIKYGAGRFDVRAGDPGGLYRVFLRYDAERMEPAIEYSDGRLEVGIEGTTDRIQGRGESNAELRVSLPRSVPTDLRLEFGAVRAQMDLGGIPLTGLRLSTGASESTIRVSEPNRASLERVRMEVGAAKFEARELGNLNASRVEVEAAVGDVSLDFSGEWRQDAHVSVKMGLGSLALNFPREVGVRVTKSGFLAPLNAPGLERRGNVWFSPGFEGSARKVTVEIEAALGNIDLSWGR
jgi:hypothetical protein